MSGFAPYKVELATVNGQTYSLPFDSGVTGLFYRTDYPRGGRLRRGRRCRTSPGTSSSTSARTSRPRPATRCSASTSTTPASSASCCSRPASGTSTPTGRPNIAGNPTFKAALETYAKLLQAGHLQAGRRLERVYRRLHLGRSRRRVHRRVDDRHHQGRRQAGKWGVAPLPKLSGVDGATHASNLGGSSWYVLASSAEKDDAIDFLKPPSGARDVDFYQKILVDQGAARLAARRPRRRRLQGQRRRIFGGQPVWQNFSDWLAADPGRRTTASSPTKSTRPSSRSSRPRQGRRRRRGHRGHRRPGAAADPVSD